MILKALPVLQCGQGGETELEQETLRRVEELLAGVDRADGYN